MLTLYHIERSQQAGFFGGTLTSVVVNISVADLMVTVILSIVGTLVSFLISMLLKKVFSKNTSSRNATNEKSPTGDCFDV